MSDIWRDPAAARERLRSKRLAYADPPYPGKAHLYPENEEVDHRELIERLETYDGWALSTDSPGLPFVLSLCRPDVRVAAWVRTNAPPFNPDGRGAIRSWEPVVYRPARAERNAPDRVRDVLMGHAPSGHVYAGLVGAKTEQFAAWVFALLVAKAGDRLDDLFPGTGVVSAAWERFEGQTTLFASALGGPRAGTRPAHAASVLRDAHGGTLLDPA